MGPHILDINVNIDDRALAREAVASPHMRWMPGMRAELDIKKPGLFALRCEGEDETDGPAYPDEHGWFPDLADPATLGCFLQIIAEINDRKSMVDALDEVRWHMGRDTTPEDRATVAAWMSLRGVEVRAYDYAASHTFMPHWVATFWFFAHPSVLDDPDKARREAAALRERLSREAVTIPEDERYPVPVRY